MEATATPTPEGPSRVKQLGLRAGGVLLATALCSALLPGIPITLGVLLLVSAALYAWAPDLQPYLEPLMRVPVAAAGRRRTHLILVAAAGMLFIVSGAVGATARGQLRSTRQQSHQRSAVAEQRVDDILSRARDLLEQGNLQRAELTLMEVDGLLNIDSQQRQPIDELLERLRRSGDSKAILEVLIQLSAQEFEGFALKERVPKALEFPERVLTLQAVERARAQLDEARRLRSGK